MKSAHLQSHKTRFKHNKSQFLVALIFMGLMAFSGISTRAQAQSVSADKKAGKVKLVEYADFQCPTCAYFYPIVKKLKAHYGNKLDVHYKFFPLVQHRYAMIAARAAQAARNQGHFQEMHDMLFKNQQEWASSTDPQDIFVNYARKMGLNIKKFKNDLNAAKTQKIVMEQKKEGQKRGVNSTPTFFINGKELPGLPRSYEQFKNKLDVYIKKVNQNKK